MADEGQARGTVFNVQYFCVHDGPGIRTTVFLKGCPMRCLWCHNPEGISPRPVLSFSAAKCVSCGACAAVCPAVHAITGGKHDVRRAVCALRGACAASCPAGALEIVGREASAAEIASDVLRDRKYYEGSGGGVTVSGGEPALQRDFLLALTKILKQENVHVALETGGFADYAVYDAALPYVDLFLYDCKETDPARHREFTGVDNAPILANLRALHGAGARILLRCPVIPGLNDRDDHFEGIAALAASLPNLAGVELLPYHSLAASKAARMGLEGQGEYGEPTGEAKALWAEKLRGLGAPVVEA